MHYLHSFTAEQESWLGSSTLKIDIAILFTIANPPQTIFPSKGHKYNPTVPLPFPSGPGLLLWSTESAVLGGSVKG